MAILKKCFNRLTFRCLMALMIGIGIMVVLVGELTLYGGEQEATSASSVTIANEKMLQNLSHQLNEESMHMSIIEPASGNKK